MNHEVQSVLVVDDESSMREFLSLLLKKEGHAVSLAPNLAGAVEFMDRAPPDLVITDLKLPDGTGIEVLKAARERDPDTQVVVITAFGSAESAVEAMKLGAYDYIGKPFKVDRVTVTARKALEKCVLARENRELKKRIAEAGTSGPAGEIFGTSPRIKELLNLVERVAQTDASVLVLGESGTGKELIAEALHRNSRGRSGPFVKVNLGGISSTLFESEMFGHVRGAFTDARADRKGRFEMAHGGTIFLDEIGELDAGSQVKLLRVLQDRTYEVLGSSQTRTVDVRVVSATNRSIAELVARGSFREDLLYRINLISVHLPPLRERPDDIPVLASRFAQSIAHSYGPDDLALGPSALAWLRRQPWPGNIRQLRQWIERAALIGRGPILEVSDFEGIAEMEPRDESRETLPPVGAMTIDEIEKAVIVKSLKHHSGNITRVAESLGLSRAALYRRLEKYGIQA